MSTVRDEVIIQPAPAQTVVSNSSVAASICALTEAEKTRERDQKIKEREINIKRLNKQLRQIHNICGPICEYMKFQNDINPDVRVILDLNQWMLMTLALKAAAKSIIDCDYADIIEPPQLLKQNMEKAYSDIDAVTDAVSSSMKSMIHVTQSRLCQPTMAHPSAIAHSSTDVCTSILSEMNPELDSKLP